MFLLTKRSIISAISVSAIVLSSYPPSAVADVEPVIATQTVKTGNWDILTKVQAFKRMNAKIVETRPWLNPKNQKIRLSDQELRSVLNKAGFSGKNLEMAIAIVYYESRFRPYALNKSSNCYGLFQINMTGSMGEARRKKYGLSKNEDLFNPVINASIAYKMSNGGTNWSSWTTENLAKRKIKS